MQGCTKEFFGQFGDDCKTKVNYWTPCWTNHAQVYPGSFTLQIMALNVACLPFKLSAQYKPNAFDTEVRICLSRKSRDLLRLEGYQIEKISCWSGENNEGS